MNLLQAVSVYCFLLVSAFAAPSPRLMLEILEKNATSAKVSVWTSLTAGKYYVNVVEKYLADVRADYYTTLVDADKRNGYFYIDTGNTLKPGTLYEVLVIPRTGNSGSVDLFTDCDAYTFACTISGISVCLDSNQLCDGIDDCSDRSDELKGEDNRTCLTKLPERPTPPPPPTNTACMQERSAAIEAGSPDLVIPECDGDGNYPPMRCEFIHSYTCHCVHPDDKTRILHSQPNYSYFTHPNFRRNCVNVRAKLKE